MQLPCKQQPQSCVIHNTLTSSNINVRKRARKAPDIASKHVHQDNKAAKPPQDGLSNLPTEILLMVCEYIPLNTQSSLAFTTPSLSARFGSQFWPTLKSKGNAAELVVFLSLLQKDIPNSVACKKCTIIHVMSGKSTNPAPFRWPWHRALEFESFYSLSRSQILAMVEGRLCERLLSCASVRTVDFWQDALRPPVTVGVWCRVRRHNDILLLNRHYIIPQSANCTPLKPISQSKATEIQVCPHVQVNSLTDGSIPALSSRISNLGYALKGGPTESLFHNQSYYASLRCQKCSTEFSLLGSDSIGNSVCDIYHALSWQGRSVERNAVGRKRRFFPANPKDDLVLGVHVGLTLRRMFEKAEGSDESMPQLWKDKSSGTMPSRDGED